MRARIRLRVTIVPKTEQRQRVGGVPAMVQHRCGRVAEPLVRALRKNADAMEF